MSLLILSWMSLLSNVLISPVLIRLSCFFAYLIIFDCISDILTFIIFVSKHFFLTIIQTDPSRLLSAMQLITWKEFDVFGSPFMVYFLVLWQWMFRLDLHTKMRELSELSSQPLMTGDITAWQEEEELCLTCCERGQCFISSLWTIFLQPLVFPSHGHGISLTCWILGVALLQSAGFFFSLLLVPVSPVHLWLQRLSGPVSLFENPLSYTEVSFLCPTLKNSFEKESWVH